MGQFMELVISDGVFKVEVVWRSTEGKKIFNMNYLKIYFIRITINLYYFTSGLQKEILALTHCNNNLI